MIFQGKDGSFAAGITQSRIGMSKTRTGEVIGIARVAFICAAAKMRGLRKAAVGAQHEAEMVERGRVSRIGPEDFPIAGLRVGKPMGALVREARLKLGGQGGIILRLWGIGNAWARNPSARIRVMTGLGAESTAEELPQHCLSVSGASGHGEIMVARGVCRPLTRARVKTHQPDGLRAGFPLSPNAALQAIIAPIPRMNIPRCFPFRSINRRSPPCASPTPSPT